MKQYEPWFDHDRNFLSRHCEEISNALRIIMCIKQLVSCGRQAFASPHSQWRTQPFVVHQIRKDKQCSTALHSLVFVLWFSACRCQTSLPVSAYAVKLYEIVTAVCDLLFVWHEVTEPSRPKLISNLISAWISLLRVEKFHYSANVSTNGRISPQYAMVTMKLASKRSGSGIDWLPDNIIEILKFTAATDQSLIYTVGNVPI